MTRKEMETQKQTFERMKTLALLAILQGFFSLGSGIPLRSSHQEISLAGVASIRHLSVQEQVSAKLEGLEKGLRHLSASACLKGDLACTGGELDELARALTDLRSGLDGNFDKAHAVFHSTGIVKSRVVKVDLLRDMLHPILKMAKSLPYVGPLFSPFEVGLNFIKTPLNKLESSLKHLDGKVFNPWEQALGGVNEKLEKVERALSAAGASILTFGLIEQSHCTGHLLRTLVPEVSEGLDLVEDGVQGLIEVLGPMVQDLQGIKKVFESHEWNHLYNALDFARAAMDKIAEPLELLSPLTDFLEKEISLPWLGDLYFRHIDGVPSNCEPGFVKAALLCYPECAEGFEMAELFGTCRSKCPPGYGNQLLRCDNRDFFVRANHFRHFKMKGLKPKFYCDEGWRMIGLRCWEECPDGWKNGNILTEHTCYKDCPNGMSNSIGNRKCNKLSYGQKAVGPTCDEGYSIFMGLCHRNCKEDEEEFGPTCYKPKTVTFKLADIADKLDEVIGKIENLPVVKQIKEGIEKAIRFVVDPILSVLGLPELDGLIPSFDFDIGIDMLPVFDLKSRLDALNPAHAMGELIGNLEDAAMEQIERFSGAFKFPDASWMECLDPACIASKIPGLDISFPDVAPFELFLDEVGEAREELKDMLNSIGNNLGACKKTEKLSMDFVEKIAEFTDIAPPKESCEVEFEVCTEIELERNVGAEKNLGNLLSPIISRLQCRLEHGVNSSRCEDLKALHRNLRAGDEGAAVIEGNATAFTIPLGMIPVHPLLPIPEKFKRMLHFDWDSVDKKEKKMSGGYINVAPLVAIPLRIQRDTFGNFSLEFDYQLEININVFYARKNTADLVEAAIEQLFKAAEDLDGTVCFSEYSERFNVWNCDPTINSPCQELCQLREIARKPHLWEWDGSNSPDASKLLKDRSKAEWHTDLGLVQGEKITKFVRKMHKRIKSRQLDAEKLAVSTVKKRMKNWLGQKFMEILETDQRIIPYFDGNAGPYYAGLDFKVFKGMGPFFTLDVETGIPRSVGIGGVKLPFVSKLGKVKAFDPRANFATLILGTRNKLFDINL